MNSIQANPFLLSHHSASLEKYAFWKTASWAVSWKALGIFRSTYPLEWLLLPVFWLKVFRYYWYGGWICVTKVRGFTNVTNTLHFLSCWRVGGDFNTIIPILFFRLLPWSTFILSSILDICWPVGDSSFYVKLLLVVGVAAVSERSDILLVSLSGFLLILCNSESVSLFLGVLIYQLRSSSVRRVVASFSNRASRCLHFVAPDKYDRLEAIFNFNYTVRAHSALDHNK